MREAIYYQYAFLTTALEGKDGQVRYAAGGNVPPVVTQALHHLHQWLGQSLDESELPTRLPDERRKTVRLYPLSGQPQKWRTNPPWAAYADVEFSDDTLTILLAYGRTGEADPDTWRRLRQGDWQPSSDERFGLGSTVCFGGRVPDLAAATAEAEAVLPAPDPERPHPLRRVDLPFGWLFDRPDLSDRLALFYWDTDESERLASDFFNMVQPGLALARHKLEHYYARGYQRGLLLVLERKERTLAAVLARIRTPKQSLDALEDQLQELAGSYHNFAASLAEFERLQQVIKVNLINLRRLFNGYRLPHAGLLADLGASAKHAVRQLQADSSFYRATVHQARIAFSTLQVQAEIKRGQMEEAENRLTGQRNLKLTLFGIALSILGTIAALGGVTTEQVAAAFISRVFGVTTPSPGEIFAGRVGLIATTGLILGGVAWSVYKVANSLCTLRTQDSPSQGTPS